MFTIVLYALVACLSTLRVRYHEEHERLDTEGICYTCNYDLSGTPAALPCPECGSTKREHYRTRETSTIHVHERRLGWAIFMGLLVLAYLGLARPLAEALVISSYEAMGYGPDVARRAAYARELRQEPTEILWPITAVLILSPLIGFLSHHRRRLTALAILLAIACALLVYEWYISYLPSRR
jgi:predicted RNA-binding Zn-ribbon protein involved in translation (DUF1610 family)